MSRLIDAVKLMQDFTMRQGEIPYNVFYGVIKDTVDKQATAEQESGWIPCSERLPDDYVNVLTCDKKGNIHIFSHCKGYEYPFCIPPDHTRYYMPVAWQPLPTAFKEADSK